LTFISHITGFPGLPQEIIVIYTHIALFRY